MPTTWRHAPRQSRSAATERRLVVAATRLLARRGYERLAISEVARAARTSVGGLYARFADKQALLHAIDEDLIQRMTALVDQAMAEDALRTADVAQVIAAYVTMMVKAFARHRPLLREISLRARQSGDPAFATRVRSFNDHAHGLLTERLLQRRAAIRHPRPEEAIAFGVLMVSAAAREVVLFGDPPLSPGTLRGRRLMHELTTAYCAYLGATLPKEPSR
ncbi:MAG: TetR/AcrR family transcriptional regulator [Planctomycetes bacterium]|nr:TetR/AcrR family transcriptional regulator [Planctomycetota bacterium]